MRLRRINPAVVIGLILFFVPFFWFAWGEGDWGGDSTRLYFLDPDAWLKSYGWSEINVTDWGYNNPNHFLIPFLVLIKGLHAVFFGQVHLVLATFNGFLLSISFAAMYAVIRDLHPGQERGEHTRLSAIIGALFFILIPVMAYNWQKALYSWHQIAVYPLLFWFLLRYVTRKNTIYLLYGLVLTVVFSVNFNIYVAAPTLFSFWPFALLLLAIVAAQQHKMTWLWRGAALFGGLFVLLHSFHTIPYTRLLFSSQTSIYQNVFTSAGRVSRGLNYFESVRPMVKFVYNITGFPQYSLYTKTGASPHIKNMIVQYGVSVMAAFFLFPLVVVLGLFGSTQRAPPEPPQQRILFLSTLLLWLLALFLMTANLFSGYGPRLYAALFALPGFAMFRSFYGVFVVPLSFIYAIAFGMGLRYVLLSLSRRVARAALVAILILTLLYGGWPMLSGQVVNTIISDTNNLTLSNRLPDDFMAMLAEVKSIELDAKYLTMPLTQYDYQIIADERGGAYVGPSPLGILGGKHTFSGLSVFSIPGSRIFSADFFMDRVRAKDYRTLNRIFSLMNIGFMFENTSPVAYREGFTGFPYSQDVWRLWPDNASIRDFIGRLGYRPMVERGSFHLYSNPEAFLPHVYIPRSIVRYRHPDELADYLTTAQVYDLQTAFFQADTAVQVTPVAAPDTQVEFKKIHEMKYRIRVHNLKGTVPLVFSNAYLPGWKLFVTRQSPSAELPDGPLWESWRLPLLPDTYHQRVNEYANAWELNLPYLQAKHASALISRPDGGYDVELLLEFTPMRIFYGSSVISLITAAGILGYLGWVAVVRLRERAI